MVPAWERAIRRAAIRGITPRQYDTATGTGCSVIRRYFVSSGNRDGLRHSVRIEITAAGITLECTCEGSLHGHICWHCGSMLMAEGWTDEPAPESETLERLNGKRSLALLNGEFDEVDRLDAELAALVGGAAS
jgi:hypothetical protein